MNIIHLKKQILLSLQLINILIIQMKFYFASLFLLLANFLANSQTIEGTILDATTNQPIEGVHIKEKESDQGGYSDQQGYFKFDSSGESILVSHIGYLETEIDINNFHDKFVIYLKHDPISLNEVQLNITKNQLSNFSQSASISTLSDTEIQENVSRSIAESMMGTPGVWMQKTNHGGGSPFVRGLTGNYVLTLIDGIRLNNSTFRYGPNQYFNTISPFSVSSIEILRGAGSTLYGSDAIGGTININTKNTSVNTNKKLYGNAFVQVMSKDMEYTGGLELGGKTQNFAFISNGSIRKFGDSYAGEGLGLQNPSAYSEKDFMFKGKIKFDDTSHLIFNYQWLRQDEVPRYDQVAQKNYEYYNFTLQQRQLAYLRYEKYFQTSFLNKFQITGSFQESNEERDTKKNDQDINKNERDDISTFRFTSQIDALIFDKIETLAGFDFYYDWIASSRTLTNTSTNEKISDSRGLYPDGSNALSAAFYNTYLYNIRKWNFQFGWRINYTLNQLEDELFDTLDQSSSSFVWNASVNYHLGSSRIYAAVNTAFRAPNISDISSLGDFDYGIEVPTNDLNPESSINFELGYKITRKTFRLNMAYFYTRIADLIDRVPTTFNGKDSLNGSKVYKKANVGEAIISGFEVEMQKKFLTYFSLKGSLTYTYGENVSKEEPFRRIPPLFGNFSLKYHKKSYFMILQTLAAAKQNRLSGGDMDDHRIPDNGTPGWFVVNLKSGSSWKKFDFNLALNNLFNEAYRMHGSGVDGIGMHIAGLIRYRF